MARSTVFMTDRSRAVRMPKAVALPEGVHEVKIVKRGQAGLVS